MFGIRGLRGVAPALCALCMWALGTVAAFGGETVPVVDQLGRMVKVPARVERIVCLHHHTLDILLELGQGDGHYQTNSRFYHFIRLTFWACWIFVHVRICTI